MSRSHRDRFLDSLIPPDSPIEFTQMSHRDRFLDSLISPESPTEFTQERRENMPIQPTIKTISTSTVNTYSFAGYDHNLKIKDGSFYETENLSTDRLPVLAPRERRGLVQTLQNPGGLIAKDALAYIDGNGLYYNGRAVTGIFLDTTPSVMAKRQLVSMGAYLVIFPDKLYLNTQDTTDWGYLEQSNSVDASVSNLTVALSKEDGSLITPAHTGPTAPSDPEDGDYWLDTSNHVLKIYSAATSEWNEVVTTYLKLTMAGIGAGLSVGDGITLEGVTVAEINGSHVLADCADNWLVIAGLMDVATATQTSGTVTTERSCPDMDFVTESQNRLWGCKYGLVDGETVNEIYCCALGDFKNWNKFEGISTDSWAASCGTDGQWTGAITHLGYPLFFKETCVHKVYVSGLGAHEIAVTDLRGVRKGCHKSLCIVNEVLYYVSRDGVCAYDGALPTKVSAALGVNAVCEEAVAGCRGNKLYLSMKVNGTVSLFQYDTSSGVWMREDGLQARDFAATAEDLYCLATDGKLWALGGSSGTREDALSWSAQTGVIGFSYNNKKYLSRFNLKLAMDNGAPFQLFVRYDDVDGTGAWIPCGTLGGEAFRTFVLPVRPRRCDHLEFKMTGTGDFRLYSFSKVLEIGSDY